jgi:Uma2 family endonuclease
MLVTQTKPLTLEQFLALPETNPASEYIATGEIVQKPMPQGKRRWYDKRPADIEQKF